MRCMQCPGPGGVGGGGGLLSYIGYNGMCGSIRYVFLRFLAALLKNRVHFGRFAFI